MPTRPGIADGPRLLHDSLNRNPFKDKIMQRFEVLLRPWRVRLDARRCRAPVACERHRRLSPSVEPFAARRIEMCKPK
ncbi:hypothetical protein GHK48_05360 [Sinorhizobium fredii]|uniref:Uncharacterized protein n=1 Tax=Rhizobium fredii TaxID=380 RepID=A0A844A5G8_RHIFR|nr:hypothetical protein [Sinorhizobium fredii]